MFDFSREPSLAAVREYELWSRKEHKFGMSVAVICWLLTVVSLGFVLETAHLKTVQVIAVWFALGASLAHLVLRFAQSPIWEEFELKAEIKQKS